MSPVGTENIASRPTHTVENYLMTMYVMERDQGEIVAARLAEELDVAPATVAMTLKRMERDNWISGKSRRKGINLTETGREAAHSVVRRHMLTEWLLLKILKLPFHQIHAEAHNIEHAISPQLEARLVDILEDPKVCPHGNPFPGCEQVTRAWIALTEIESGQKVVIRRVHELAENNQELLGFLIQNKILPGGQAEVLEVLPFNQTIRINIAGNPCTLGFSAARYIFVEKSTLGPD
jgi:DtxR family Mn-dependent transcriptional regulator